MPRPIPIDLVCIDGRRSAVEVRYSLNALIHSASGLNFNRALFITAASLHVPPGIQAISIPPIANPFEYSEFVVKRLHDFVEADYCLVVQWDGFVKRPERWDTEFLNFDYIGAPWPETWTDRRFRVGNGGFSLRSRKLLELASSLDFNATTDGLEDNFLCLQMHERLEAGGVRFAPPSVAARFSWENPVAEGSFEEAFGFHGRDEQCISTICQLHRQIDPTYEVHSHQEEQRRRKSPLGRVRRLFGMKP